MTATVRCEPGHRAPTFVGLRATSRLQSNALVGRVAELGFVEASQGYAEP